MLNKLYTIGSFEKASDEMKGKIDLFFALCHPAVSEIEIRDLLAYIFKSQPTQQEIKNYRKKHNLKVVDGDHIGGHDLYVRGDRN